MKKMFKLDLASNKAEEITIFESAGTRKLDSMNLDPKDVLLDICAETKKDEDAESIAKSALAHMCNEGYTLNGKTFVPFMAPAGKIRKATSTFIDKKYLPEFGKWSMCGLKSSEIEIAPNKFMSYIGLLWSASKTFAKLFGKPVNIRRVAIIKDLEVFVDGIADIVAKNNEISYAEARKVVINALDGFGVINRVITKGESVTIRGPWLKAFVQAVNWDELVKFGVEFVDFWGNKVKLQDVDMILTESCFKTAKLYQSWEQYCSAFEQLGHELAVCVREHGAKLKGMPYQQGQTLLGTEYDAHLFMQHAKTTVAKYQQPENAAKLLYGYHAMATKMYPALLNESYTKKAIQEKYTTKYNDMRGGRNPELGYNAFLAPDIIAFAEHLFGKEVKGVLKAGECACKTVEKGLVDITRNPHFDNAHVLLNNKKYMGKLVPIGTPTMFINIWDFTTLRLRADYDGDHVWFSQDKHLLDLVNRTYNTIKNVCVDWNVEKAKKVPITRSAIASFITNMIHGSEIGLYADALTKMWNHGYNRDVCDWLTYAGNVLIDAAKHADVRVKKPEAVQALDKIQLPLFAMYAKADLERPIGDYWLKERITESGKVLPARCAYTGSFLDMYSKMVSENIDEVLTIDGTENMIFDSTKMMIDPHRKIGRLAGLSKKGTWNFEEKKSEGHGLFQGIAFRHSTEWNELIKQDNFFENRREWEEETARIARKEIIDWARAQYPDTVVSDEAIDDACYDIIVRNIFNTKMSEGFDTVIKQAFWRIYGDKAVTVLKQNLADSCILPDFDSEEFEGLFDTDDCEN